MNKEERTLSKLIAIVLCISVVGILLRLDGTILLCVIVVPVVLVGVWYLYKVEIVCNEAYRKELIKEVIKEMKEDKNLEDR